MKENSTRFIAMKIVWPSCFHDHTFLIFQHPKVITEARTTNLTNWTILRFIRFPYQTKHESDLQLPSSGQISSQVPCQAYHNLLLETLGPLSYGSTHPIFQTGGSARTVSLWVSLAEQIRNAPHPTREESTRNLMRVYRRQEGGNWLQKAMGQRRTAVQGGPLVLRQHQLSTDQATGYNVGCLYCARPGVWAKSSWCGRVIVLNRLYWHKIPHAVQAMCVGSIIFFLSSLDGHLCFSVFLKQPASVFRFFWTFAVGRTFFPRAPINMFQDLQ